MVVLFLYYVTIVMGSVTGMAECIPLHKLYIVLFDQYTNQ